MKDRPAKLEPVYRSQSPGKYFRPVDATADLQPQIKVTGRDGKITRGAKMDDGNARRTTSLDKESKGVKGTFGTGPAYFRSRVLGDLRGFRQAKSVDSECTKPHRVGSNPAPRQMIEPMWQKWTPREPV